MHLDNVLLHHPALRASMKKECVTYMGQTPGSAKAIKELIVIHELKIK